MRPWVLVFLLCALGAGGCSSYRPLKAREGLDQLTAQAVTPSGHRVLIAPVSAAPAGREDEGARAAMRLDAHALATELETAVRAALALEPDSDAVAVARDAASAAEEAWERGYDLLLQVRLTRWDAVFLDTNGWWYPNAFFVGWYFWPIGSLGIADEVYGVDVELVFDVIGVAAERPLEHLSGKRIVVRTPPPGEEETLGPRDVLPAPRFQLDDLDRGFDLLGTWTPGDLDPEQWGKVGELLEPHARRVSAVRLGAGLADELAAFDALSPAERERNLAAVHGLVIGISAYREPCLAADADAERFSRLLRGTLPAGAGEDAAAGDEPGPGPGGAAGAWAPAKNVALLQNGKATRAGILGALAHIRARAAPEDRLVLFFAGRGARGPGAGLEGFLLHTYGSGPEDVLSLAELARELADIPASSRLLVLDTDFAPGARGAAGAGSATPIAPAQLAGWVEGGFLPGGSRGAVVLATDGGPESRVQTYAVEGDEQGLLSRYLIEGLAGAADAGGDGLSYADLAAYLERYVTNLAAVALDSPQRPRVISPQPQALVR